MHIYTASNSRSPLNSLTILGQLLLCALLAALSNSPSELVSLSGIFVSRQDLGVLSSFDLLISTVSG
jgi:hypothetical protein